MQPSAKYLKAQENQLFQFKKYVISIPYTPDPRKGGQSHNGCRGAQNKPLIIISKQFLTNTWNKLASVD